MLKSDLMNIITKIDNVKNFKVHLSFRKKAHQNLDLLLSKF